MTLKEVAPAIGVAVSTYREWEYGRVIKGEPYSALAGVFEVGVSELLIGQPPIQSSIGSELEAVKKHLMQFERQLSSLF